MPNPSAETASPCNQICTLDAANVCIGCGRRAQEIAAWPQASEAERRRIVERARERLAALAAAKMRA